MQTKTIKLSGRALRPYVTHVCVVLVHVLLLTLITRWVITDVFSIPLNPQFAYRDLLGNMAVTVTLLTVLWSVKKTLVLSALLITLFQVGNAAKLSILGTPASPDDFFNIQNFFFLTDGWRQVALFMLAALPIILLVIFIPWRRRTFYISAAALLIAIKTTLIYSEPLRITLDTHIGNSVWNQPDNFYKRGLTLHLFQETVRTMSKVGQMPDSDAVKAAKSALGVDKVNNTQSPATGTGSAPSLKRNVHIFVLESFFDATQLGTEWVPEDPFPTAFRQLWQQTEQSTILSPVFGGYTANAEFEALCGFPVQRHAVFFEGWLRQPAPCLPRLLSEAGYRTVASHPNVPGFWNRTHAYRLIGFDHYWSRTDFDMSDSVDTLLMDHSLYSQVFKRLDNGATGRSHHGQANHPLIEQDSVRVPTEGKLTEQHPTRPGTSNTFNTQHTVPSQPPLFTTSKLDSDQPLFNYMLTYHGHLPYPNSPNYPDQVRTGQHSTLLHGYINQVWYKSRALMERLDWLRHNDPTALIVVFGDHLPFLGRNFDIYRQAWQLPAQQADFSGAQLKKLTQTPLIIIDGLRGPINTGAVPLYRLPALMLSLLGYQHPTPLDWTLNPPDKKIRPVYGMHIALQGENYYACTGDGEQSSVCSESSTWLRYLDILSTDLFTGKQYGLFERSLQSP